MVKRGHRRLPCPALKWRWPRMFLLQLWEFITNLQYIIWRPSLPSTFRIRAAACGKCSQPVLQRRTLYKLGVFD